MSSMFKHIGLAHIFKYYYLSSKIGAFLAASLATNKGFILK
jgi:hypothetical protein